MALTVQVLMSPGCGHGRETVELVIDVATDAEAQRLAFPGSPTVLVDGADIDPGPPGGVGLG